MSISCERADFFHFHLLFSNWSAVLSIKYLLAFWWFCYMQPYSFPLISSLQVLWLWWFAITHLYIVVLLEDIAHDYLVSLSSYLR